jgi:hypothetical protein
MASISVKDLIRYAFEDAGLFAAEDTLPDGDLNRGVLELNDLIEQWNTENFWPYTNETIVWNSVVNQKFYEIGIGAEIDKNRPLQIEALALIEGGTYIPLVQKEDSNWVHYLKNDEATVGQPEFFIYRPTFPNGRIELYPIPSRIYEMRMTVQTLIIEYGKNDTIDLPPGYRSALRSGLAAVLALVYQAFHVMGPLAAVAETRKDRVKKQNVTVGVLTHKGLPRRGRGPGYNTRTDTFKGSSS